MICNKNIILGSGSPRRRELMSQIGLKYEVIVSDAEEYTREIKPDLMVMDLSRKKAEAVRDNLSKHECKDSLIIGADTIVYCDGVVLGKPKSTQDAVNMIKSLAGKVHSVYTGVTVLVSKEDNVDAKDISFAEETKVYVYPMSDAEIDDYVSSGDCMDKAGAYGIQGAFAAYIKCIEGDYNNVVGLPVARLYQELRKAGYIVE